MTTAHPGVTHCPHCGGELAPTVVDDDRPLQVLEQYCDGCDYTTVIGVIWYPADAFYEVVGRLTDTRECVSCRSDGRFCAIDSRTTVATVRCWECLRSHHERAFRRAVRLSEDCTLPPDADPEPDAG